jgi:hypothetical protein
VRLKSALPRVVRVAALGVVFAVGIFTIVATNGGGGGGGTHTENHLSTIYVGDGGALVWKTTPDTYDQGTPRRGEVFLAANRVPSDGGVRVSAVDFGLFTHVAMKQLVRDPTGGANLDEVKVFIQPVGADPAKEIFSHTAGLSTDASLAVAGGQLYVVWARDRELHVHRHQAGAWRDLPVLTLSTPLRGFDATGLGDKLIVGGKTDDDWYARVLEITVAGDTLTETRRAVLDPYQRIEGRVSLSAAENVISVAFRMVSTDPLARGLVAWHFDGALSRIRTTQFALRDDTTGPPSIAWKGDTLWMAYGRGNVFELRRLLRPNLTVDAWDSPTWRLNDGREQTSHQIDVLLNQVLVPN